MNEIWSLFKKKEFAPLVITVALVVFVFSIIGCIQNYQTTYEQLSRVFGKDIGLTFTALSQAVEFLVPILLAWGVMKSLKFSWQITLFVVVTGIVAWVTDAATAGQHFWVVAYQSPWLLRVLWTIIGTFLFVTMEVWVMLSAVTILAAFKVLGTGELPMWLTQPSKPVETPHLDNDQPAMYRHPAAQNQRAAIRPPADESEEGATWTADNGRRTYIVCNGRWEELRKPKRLEFSVPLQS